MMYFLVSTPPKTFCAVRPAFSAMSVKVAIGAGGGAGGFACCADSEGARNNKQPQTRVRKMGSIREKEETRMGPVRCYGRAGQGSSGAQSYYRNGASATPTYLSAPP